MNRCHKLIISDLFIYSFLTIEETETQKLNDLPEVIELESGKIKIPMQETQVLSLVGKLSFPHTSWGN